MRGATRALDKPDAVKIAVLDAFPPVGNGGNGEKALSALGLGSGHFENFVAPLDESSAECAEHACDGALTTLGDVSSHGLFVASVLQDIAPDAELKIFRVVNDYGAGDMVSLTRGIEAAITWAKGDKLILNMSLGFGPPLALVKPLLQDVTAVFDNQTVWNGLVNRHRPPKIANVAVREVEKLFGHKKAATRSTLARLTAGPDPLATRDAKGDYHLSGPLAGLDLIFHLGDIPNVLAVAATGNDSCHGHEPHAPRVPAAVMGVLGVSSFRPGRGIRDRVEREWEREDYANDDDLFPNNDGVGAWGGALDPDKGSSAADKDAPIGLYQEANGTIVRVHWSGTSFATPIVAGFAAALWAEADFPTGADLRKAIVEETETTGRESLDFRQQRYL